MKGLKFFVMCSVTFRRLGNTAVGVSKIYYLSVGFGQHCLFNLGFFLQMLKTPLIDLGKLQVGVVASTLKIWIKK